MEIVQALSTSLIVWWVANEALSHFNIHINFSGKIIAFIMYINQIFRPLRVIADKFNVLQMGMIAAERVFKVMDNDDIMTDTGTRAVQKIRGAIEFDHVWFAYNEEQYVLKLSLIHI